MRATLTRKLFERRAIPEKRSNIRATIISINEETQRAEGADSAAAGAEVDARPEGSLREIDGDALGAAEPSEKRARSAPPPASAMDSSSTSPVTVASAPPAPEGGQPDDGEATDEMGASSVEDGEESADDASPPASAPPDAAPSPVRVAL